MSARTPPGAARQGSARDGLARVVLGEGELAPRARLGLALAAQALLVAASPGVLAAEPSLPLAILSFTLWCLHARRPGRLAFPIEALAGGLGVAGQCVWIHHVWAGALAFLTLVPGVYVGLAGVLLRRLAPRLPLALAAPLAFVALEVARLHVPTPFGYGWIRLGTHAAGALSLAAAARVVGVHGLSFAWAASGAALATAALARARAARVSGAALALLPLALARLVASASAPPELREGPRVLCVQPAFAQARKQETAGASELFRESLALTASGLRAAAERGEVPDLVCWGETMLPLPVFAPGLEQALARGATTPGWARDHVDLELVQRARALERAWVGESLLGAGPRRGLLPAGCCFASGVESYVLDPRAEERAGSIRRTNAIVLWGPGGERLGEGAKLHLVPGAEALAGFERFAWVREATQAVAGYVPDLLAAERAGVVALPWSGGSAQVGLSVCFDNAFDDPYTEPLRRGPLDFYLVCSNEAWYEGAFEMDQMVAMTRLLALQSARSIVRATNAGITTVIGPDGRERARLVAEGSDRMVAGTLSCAVPIPAVAAGPTPYVRAERLWLAAFVLAPLLALLLPRRRALELERVA